MRMASRSKIRNINRASTSDSDDEHVTSDGRINPLLNPETSDKKTFKHASLPRLELALCILITIVSTVYIKYRMAIISKEHIGSMRLVNFKKPWFFYNHGYADVSDYEWRFWKTHTLTLEMLYSVFAYIVLGRVVDWFFPEIRKMYILSFSLLSLCFTMSPRLVMFFAGHTAVAYLGSLTRRKWVIWLIALIQTASIFANVQFYRWQKEHLPGLGDVIVQFTFSILRFVSFGLECCRTDNEEAAKDYGLLDMLLYNFYFPLFKGGPVLTFDQFQSQINKPAAGPLNRQEWLRILKNTVRYIIWYFYFDIFLHFSYHYAFHKHRTIFSSLEPQDYGVLAGFHLLFFQIKYVIFYGFPGVLTLFDRIESPMPPSCIGGFYTFRDMWRYFDRGLHTFIMRYIYFPMGGSKFGVFWNSMAALLAFSFMGLWHGNSYKMYTWALCNWFGIQLETVFFGLSWTPKALEKQRSMSGAGLRRLCAAIAVFNRLILTVSNMVFLAGYPNIWDYLSGLFVQGFPMVPLATFIIWYCHIQVVFEAGRKHGMEYIYEKKYI